MNKTVSVSLSVKSLKDAAKEIARIKTAIEKSRAIFIKRSVDWIRARASENIAVNYPDFVNDFIAVATDNLGIVETAEEQMTYIEFGTGIKGQSSPHELANKNNYQYDVNSHGEAGWHFTYYSDTKLDVKESDIISRTRGNHAGMWEKIHTQGAEAERFMFNAFTDYYNGGVFQKIYKQALEQAMG